MKIDDFKNLIKQHLPAGFTVESLQENALYVVIKNPSGKKGIGIDMSQCVHRVKTDGVETLARMVQLSFKRARNGMTELHYGG